MSFAFVNTEILSNRDFIITLCLYKEKTIGDWLNLQGVPVPVNEK